MAIPDFQSLMLPLPKFAADGTERASREAADSLSQLFELSDEEKEIATVSQKGGKGDQTWAICRCFESLDG